MKMQNNLLSGIIDNKIQENIEKRSRVSLSEMKQRAYLSSNPRNFLNAISDKILNNQSPIIAEVKNASPSSLNGSIPFKIRDELSHIQIAKSYQGNGATCISVVTDKDFFQGKNNELTEIKNAVSIPVLRKDFIIDEYQVYESRAMGADCILLIMDTVPDNKIRDLIDLSRKLNLSVLLEVSDKDQLDRALLFDTLMIGINNRDLTSLNINIENTINLSKYIPQDKIIISESGVQSKEDIDNINSNSNRKCGFLIGTKLLKSPNVGKSLKSFFSDKEEKKTKQTSTPVVENSLIDTDNKVANSEIKFTRLERNNIENYIEMAEKLNFNCGNIVKYVWKYHNDNSNISYLEYIKYYIDREINRNK